MQQHMHDNYHYHYNNYKYKQGASETQGIDPKQRDRTSDRMDRTESKGQDSDRTNETGDNVAARDE